MPACEDASMKKIGDFPLERTFYLGETVINQFFNAV
jgi:hypothetical protein